jgi:hypothetical protein
VSVLDDILCAPPPPPPADIDTDETTVDRTVAPCVSCHMLIDPIGSGFEHYDAIGSYRLEDEEGEAIDASGELVVSDVDGPFYGAVELGQQLAQSDSVRQCFTRQWFRFALQRMDRTDDDCVLETLSESWSTNEEPIVELMVALANSPAMRYRQVPLPEEE